MALIKSNHIYDWAKFAATTLLPALNVFWLAIGTVWGLPFVQEIGATIAAVNALLGAIVGISSAQHVAKK